ncbi:alpha/beta hydrolase [Streptomyces sp. NPDC088253]|uniref:alpha/beta hydrolase n=1 Tax=Streptomyces sp. NPDC088253 TaxID=3365846 RepID=UPI003801B40B
MKDVTDQVSGEREKFRFSRGGSECAAWHCPGSDGSCVITAGGFAVTKEPGTDLFARRFHDAGFGVPAFECRGFGESGGRPRQVASFSGQLAHWRAAVAFAATLPGADRSRLALWGFSASAGHLLRVAARTPHLAAVIARTPNVGGPAAARLAARHQKPLSSLRLLGRGAAHERAVDAEVSFPRRHVLDSPVASVTSVGRR